MREFYQCDFDIAGVYDAMLPDAEIIRITCEIFEGLGWKGNYTIKINHRKILDGIFAVCGVPQDKTRTISSAVDKLDKVRFPDNHIFAQLVHKLTCLQQPWTEVRREMTEDKGLDPDVADKIGDYVQLKGSQELLDKLLSDTALMANESAKKGLDDMALLFNYLTTFGVLPKISFDMSLARGLDYYTGVIYEVITEGSAPGSAPANKLQKAAKAGKGKEQKSADADEDRSNDPSVGVGSVAAGGRYDELVGMFSGKQQIPCVGISFGVDRIFSIIKSRMEASANASTVRSTEVDVYVMAFGGKGFTGLLTERMNLAKTLWDAGIKAEFSWKVKPKLPAQFKLAEQGGVPFAVILGEEEVKQGKCKSKEMGLPEGHPEKEGVEVEMSKLVEEMRARLAKWYEENPVDELTGKVGALEV